jgi:hypothetical protein
VDWFRVDVAFVLSAEFLALPEAPRAHWLALAAYCAQQENGGVLKGAVAWRDREWSFSAGMRQRSVRVLVNLGLVRIHDLCQQDYVLVRYDVDGEHRHQRTSETNANNAKVGWQKRAAAEATADAKNERRNARTNETRRDERDVQSAASPPVERTLGLRQVTDEFQARYVERSGGIKPTWGPKQFGLLKPLVKQHGAEEVCRRIGVLFTSPPSFLAASMPDIGTLAQHFDKLAAAAVSVASLNGKGYVAMSGDQLRALAQQMRERGVK